MRMYVIATNNLTDEEIIERAKRWRGHDRVEDAIEEAEHIASIYHQASDDMREMALPMRVVGVELVAEIFERIEVNGVPAS